MSSVVRLSTVNPNERMRTRPVAANAKCTRCGVNPTRSVKAKYCAPCKDEIDLAKEAATIERLQTYKRPLPRIQE